MKRWLLFALMVVVLGSCSEEKPRHRSNLRAGVNVTPRVGFQLETSTDCTEVGQPITFILTFYNRDERPIEIEAVLPLDIILAQPTKPPTIVARWSDSDSYLKQLPPLESGEIRPYTWTWIPNEEVGVVMVSVQMTLRDATGKLWPFTGKLETTGVGEGVGQIGDHGVVTRCSEMAPAR